MIQRRMRWLAGLSAVSLLLGAAAACSKREPVSNIQVVQYNLIRLDSQPLPHQLDSSTVVTDMLLSVAEDATWHSTGHRTVTTNGVSSTQLMQSSGTYVASGSNFTFRNASGGIVWQGTFSFPPPKYTLTDSSAHEYVFCRSDFDPAQCGVQAALSAGR